MGGEGEKWVQQKYPTLHMQAIKAEQWRYLVLRWA